MATHSAVAADRGPAREAEPVLKTAEKEEIERWFGRADPWRFDGTVEDMVRTEVLMGFIRHGRFRNALDIGCAEGVLTERYAPSVGHVDAFDLSETAIERARKRGLPNVDFFPLDMRETGTLAGPYDLVLCSECLYYIPTDEGRASVLDDVHKLMTDDGLLIFSSIVVGPKEHRRYFTFDEAKALLDRRFRVVAAVPNLVRLETKPLRVKAMKLLGKLVPSWRRDLERAITVTTAPQDAYQVAFACIKR